MDHAPALDDGPLTRPRTPDTHEDALGFTATFTATGGKGARAGILSLTIFGASPTPPLPGGLGRRNA